MKLTRAILVAAICLAACDDDPTRSSPPGSTLTVEAVPLEDPIDHGWATVQGDSFRMEPDGDRLLVRGIPVAPGAVEVRVRAVDANETEVFAGSGEAVVEAGAQASEVEIPMLAVRPDLRLVALAFKPQMPVAGDSLKIQVEVGNEGSGRSGPTQLILRVGAEAEGKSWELPPMRPGDVLRFERRLVLGQAQIYQVLAFVDPLNQVPEFIDTNNAAIGRIEVGPAP